MHRAASGSRYPWMQDRDITDAWIADPEYLDSTVAVGTWSPQKGSISLTQSSFGAKPSWASTWGAAARGMCVFDGIDDHLIGNALAAKATGRHAYTLIMAVQVVTLRSLDHIASFGHNDGVAGFDSFHVGTSPNFAFSKEINNDAGTIFVFNGATPGNTNRHVVTWLFNGSNLTDARLDNAALGLGGNTPLSGVVTLNHFTMGAFSSTTVGPIRFSKINARALLFAPSVLSTAQYQRCVKYLVSEAA